MPIAVRQKACVPCASSKRKCDKQLPECRRCLDRDVDCVYPQPRRRRRDVAAREPQLLDDFGISNVPDVDLVTGNLGVGSWGVIDDAGIDASFHPLTMGSSTPESEERRPEAIDISCPWFLREESWALQRNNEEPGCVTKVELEPFIKAVNGMLQSWTRDGHNNFIHRRLYDKGMPRCLQHAFTTLATYLGRTPAIKETVLSIVEESAFELLNESSPVIGDAQGIRNYLARIQALFIYTFIRLFDGSVRMRASAETQLSTLRQWLSHLWEVVRKYRGEDQLLGNSSTPWNPNHFDMEYNASSELWKLWLLTESVRRTHLIAGTIANMYEIMARGWVECTGAVMFTGRQGLWDADSAVKWYELSCAKSPLLVPALQPGLFIAQHAADEFDEFTKLIWTFIVGADKVQCWIDKSRTDLLSIAVL